MLELTANYVNCIHIKKIVFNISILNKDYYWYSILVKSAKRKFIQNVYFLCNFFSKIHFTLYIGFGMDLEGKW